jgi:hypothetical protein
MERDSKWRIVRVAIASLLYACGSSGPGPAEVVIPPPRHVDASTSSDDADSVEPDDASTGSADASPESGDDEGGPTVGRLDCPFLSAPNCWQAAAAAADSCLPEVGMLGTLSADGTMCTYASGSTVTFPSPIVVNGMSSFSSFTVTTGGATCVTYAQQGTGGSTLMTPAGTVTLSAEEDGGVLGLTCPDGTMYSGPVAALSDCPASVPGYDSASGGVTTEEGGAMDELTVSLTGTGFGSDGQLYVFGCRSP